MSEDDDLAQQLKGRASFLKKTGAFKSAGLMEQAAQAIAAAKTPSERQLALEARKKAAGLKRVCAWAHPDDAAAIRAAAAELAAKRRQSVR